MGSVEATKKCLIAVIGICSLLGNVNGEDRTTFPYEPAVLSTSAKTTPKRFQYHWAIELKGEKQPTLSRRVVVERDGDKHALLVMDADGFPLAHFVDNVTMCLSKERNDEVVVYDGAGFNASFGLSEQGKFGYSTKAMFPSGDSQSICRVGDLLRLLESSAAKRTGEPESDLVTLTSRTGSRAAIASQAAKDGSTRPLHSVAVRSATADMSLYGILIDEEPALSILDFAASPKEFGELKGKQVTIESAKAYPKDLQNLCETLAVKSEAARKTSNAMQLRFLRSAACREALEGRDELNKAARMEPASERLSALTAVLEKSSAVLSDPRPGKLSDPYVVAWRAEACFGPAITEKTRDVLLQSAADERASAKFRVESLRGLCRFGWPPHYGPAILKVVDTIKKESEDKLGDDFAGIDWRLCFARDGS